MKKSRIAKLALMGASITALAATLTTSTYAWYVSNKTANVEAVAGSTASSGVGSSISVSLTGDVNDYHKTISLADKTTGLSPVVRTGATIGSNGAITAVYKTLNEGVDANPSTANVFDVDASNVVTTEGTYYYQYKFYIKADTTCNVRPTITVTNNTPKLPTQINYSGGYKKVTAASAPEWAANTYYSYNAGSYTVSASRPDNWDKSYVDYYTAESNAVTGVNAGADFYVNALKATYMSLGVQTGTAYSNSVTSFKGTTTTTEASQEVNTVPNFMDVVDKSGKPSGVAEATAGAQAYYEDITGYKLTDGAKTSYAAASNFGNLHLEQNVPYMLVYHLWLDGADDQCFNACAGQTFTVAFDYTVTAE